MTLRNLFKKPVDRPIEGVIKADDEARLKLEIEEYVLTNEIEARLENFFDAYRNYNTANGAWISGFFGSGKSHLLKMLALILENREIDGTRAIDLFLPKCEKNQILCGDIKSVAAIPSKSILFNIDQRSDVISKDQTDALLGVFIKVFNEMCGYYGKHGYIAEFERDLDSRGLYAEFKSAYRQISKIDWEKGREQALLESNNIARAYAAVTKAPESSTIGILDKYKSQYKVSIEDFGDLVKKYIDHMPPNFRLNFLVDEVGQYIAENVRLMTNLQTIAETLATKCKGRAWIIVTAQEDMNTVMGEMNKQQSNDFSKIQARFANRLKLTSTDVAEVIQKRLLAKNDHGVEVLSKIFHEHSNNFRTFFDFSDGAQNYRNYNDRDHFIYCYPFIPYQFTLFQSAIQNLSAHNAFEGKHSSVGERSMLGVFQHVARHISGHKIGQLATFDLMFEGIRTALKSNIQRSILNAEKNLTGILPVKLLKALFLVKYVREFKATIRNLCILVFDNFETRLPDLKKEVEDALAYLEQQTYIQRNGEIYEFLTDEEKDIEQEIKNTDIENEAIISELEKMIFDNIIRDRKLKFEDNGQDFSFARKIDNTLRGRDYELAINIITPFNSENIDNNALRANSAMRDEVFVVMQPNDRIIRDLTLNKKTEKYVRQQNSSALSDSTKRIINDKAIRNGERYKGIQSLLSELLSESKIMVSGNEVAVNTADPKTRICAGFNELVRGVYTNLKMLKNEVYSEKSISEILKKDQGEIIKMLSEPAQEVLSCIQQRSGQGVRVTIKDIIEQFEKKPYGWAYPAILCMTAELFSSGKIELRSGGNIIEIEDAGRALLNNRDYPNIIIVPQIEFSSSQLRRAKTFFMDFFNMPAGSSEAKALGREIADKFKDMVSELNGYINQKDDFPFLSSLSPVCEKLQTVCGKPYAWYFTELLKHENELLDMKEKTIDPIKNFMTGNQKVIFENAFKFISSARANIEYIESEEAKRILEIINFRDCYKGQNLQQLKSLTDSLAEKVSTRLKEEKNNARLKIEKLSESFALTPQYSQFPTEIVNKFKDKINEVITRIENSDAISTICDNTRRFEETGFAALAGEMSALAAQVTVPASVSETSGKFNSKPGDAKKDEMAQVGNEAQPVRTIEIINKNFIRVNFEKSFLNSTEDVELYIKLMREKFLEMVKDGKTIQI